MAQKIILIDDINGEPAEETVRFGLDGTSYRIDLDADNASRLREALAEFVEHASKEDANGKARAPRAKRATAAYSKGTNGLHASARQWAQEQGIEVNPAGRVPDGIIEAYQKSQAN